MPWGRRQTLAKHDSSRELSLVSPLRLTLAAKPEPLTEALVPSLVSVIIPTRNRADKLPRALDSVLAQEGLGSQFQIQVIVIDDASSDGTPAVVRRYSTVQYFRLETQHGAAAARNVGLRASTGQYVAFLDDDDLWLPHKLRVQLPVLEKHKDLAVVYSQAMYFHGAPPAFVAPEASSARSGSVFQTLLTEGCFCPHPAVLLLRREVFEAVGYFDEQLRSSEDFDLYLRIAFRYPFQFVPGAVSVYHSTPQGLFSREITLGSADQDGHTVVQRALQRLPKTPQHERLRHEILLRTKVTSAIRKTMFASRGEKWKAALSVLGSLPEILRYRWGRGIATNVVPLIVASNAPIAAGRRWCRELRAVAGGRRSLPHWFRMQLTVATIWSETALELGHEPVVNARAARMAAALAILHNPAKLRARELRRLILGGALQKADPNHSGDSESIAES